jgi:hypothetical protein
MYNYFFKPTHFGCNMVDVNETYKKNLKELVGSAFFSIKYYSTKEQRYKNYGSLRFDVKKHLKGGESTAKEHTFTVYDMSAKHYRSFVISKTAFVKCGQFYTQDAILSGKKNVI